MSASFETVRTKAHSAGTVLRHASFVVLTWLLLSLEVAAFLALAALVFDALNWGPLLASDPSTRLVWVAVMSGLAGLLRQIRRGSDRRDGVDLRSGSRAT